jgi:hypothetical protein
MPLRTRDFEALLQTKFGFVPADKAADHRWYELKLADLPPIFTKASHGKQEIRSQLENLIAKQLHVRVAFFRGMMNCTKSREDYYAQVRQDPIPPWEKYR